MLSVNQELFIKMPIMDREHGREKGRLRHIQIPPINKNISTMLCFGMVGGVAWGGWGWIRLPQKCFSGKFLNLSEPQFLSLQNRDNKNPSVPTELNKTK